MTNKSRSLFHSRSVTTGLSDHHSMVTTMFKTHVTKLSPRTLEYRSFANFNEQNFKNDLKNILGEDDYLVGNCPNNLYSRLITDVECLISVHAPIKKE